MTMKSGALITRTKTKRIQVFFFFFFLIISFIHPFAVTQSVTQVFAYVHMFLFVNDRQVENKSNLPRLLPCSAKKSNVSSPQQFQQQLILDHAQQQYFQQNQCLNNQYANTSWKIKSSGDTHNNFSVISSVSGKVTSGVKLKASQLLGGTGFDWIEDVSVAEYGDYPDQNTAKKGEYEIFSTSNFATVTVTGTTNSNDFPATTNAFDPTYNGDYDVFVTKLNIAITDGDNNETPTLTDHITTIPTFTSSIFTTTWSTYLGGSYHDYAGGISTDSNNNIIVTGYTFSTDFPTVNGINSTFNGGLSDAFVAKFSANGTLLWSTYLGGSKDDYGRKIAVDSQNNIILLGYTSSSDFPLTQTRVTQQTTPFTGQSDLFIAKFSANGTLLWSTYLGGSNVEIGYDVDVDAEDNIFIVGTTNSADFPTRNAFDTTLDGVWDAVAAKFSANGTLLWSTYLGGSEQDSATSVSVVQSNNIIIIAGDTFSSDFPVTNNKGYDPSFNGGIVDIFVAMVDVNGTLMWSSYLGGSAQDHAYAISVDNQNHIYLVGYTRSADFPILQAFDATYNDGTQNSIGGDVVISSFNINGTLRWSTYLGGSSFEGGLGIAVLKQESDFVIVVGETDSDDFPVTEGKSYISGTRNGFISFLWLNYTSNNQSTNKNQSSGFSLLLLTFPYNLLLLILGTIFMIIIPIMIYVYIKFRYPFNKTSHKIKKP